MVKIFGCVILSKCPTVHCRMSLDDRSSLMQRGTNINPSRKKRLHRPFIELYNFAHFPSTTPYSQISSLEIREGHLDFFKCGFLIRFIKRMQPNTSNIEKFEYVSEYHEYSANSSDIHHINDIFAIFRAATSATVVLPQFGSAISKSESESQYAQTQMFLHKQNPNGHLYWRCISDPSVEFLC